MYPGSAISSLHVCVQLYIEKTEGADPAENQANKTQLSFCWYGFPVVFMLA